LLPLIYARLPEAHGWHSDARLRKPLRHTRNSRNIPPVIADFAVWCGRRRICRLRAGVKQIDGQPNQKPPELARGVFDFGAGVDVQVWRFVALRGEARDF
jgi:hypothetical protein